MAKQRKRAILFGSLLGSGPDWRDLLLRAEITPSDLLIGVDAGLGRASKLGYRMQLAVGDWDSLADRSLLKTVEHWTLPVDKDRSDLSYAIYAATQLRARRIVCLGVTGGRADHQLAMILDLASAANGELGALEEVSVLSPEGEYYFLSSKIPRWSAKIGKGRRISVLSVCGSASGVKTRGLAFAPEKGILTSSSMGLSNESTSSEVEVRLRRGNLVIVIPRENG